MLLYAIVSAIGCFATGIVIGVITRRSRSSLAKLEFKTWIKDGLSSSIIAVVFAIVAFGDGEWVDANLQYIDQILVPAIGLSFAPGLIKTITGSARQLLLAAPEPSTRRGIRRIVFGLLKGHDAKLQSLLTIALGGKLYVVTEVVVAERDASIEWMSRFRSDLEQSVAASYPEAECKTSFFGVGGQESEDSST